jgi:hypothetical protein
VNGPALVAAAGRDLEFPAQSVQRDYRQIGHVLADPGVLARARHAAHQVDVERWLGAAAGRVVGRSVLLVQVHEAGVVGWKGAGLTVAGIFAAKLAKQFDVQEQVRLVARGPAPRVGLGDKRQKARVADETRLDNGLARVLFSQKRERQAVVADQIANALGECEQPVRRLGLQNCAGHALALPRVADRRDRSVGLDARADWLADVVQQRGGVDLGSRLFVERLPLCSARSASTTMPV